LDQQQQSFLSSGPQPATTAGTATAPVTIILVILVYPYKSLWFEFIVCGLLLTNSEQNPERLTFRDKLGAG
jgi:hypothetical protein